MAMEVLWTPRQVRWGHLLLDFSVFGGPAAVLFGAMPTLSALTQIVFVGHVFPTPAAHCETVQVS